MAPGLVHHVGQLSALQGLDAHGFEGAASAYASHVLPPPLQALAPCTRLQWLDISHWNAKEPEV